MTTLEKAIRAVQKAMAKHFGLKRDKDYTGETTLFIRARSVDLTNDEATIVARGPVRVATVLLRKRRKS